VQAKTKLVILMTAALMAANVAVGYAGGGGLGGPGGEVFFQCYPAVSGPTPPHVLEVNDQFIDPTVEKIGKLKMICSFNPTVVNLGQNPPDLHVVQSPTIMTCYQANGATTKDDVVYTDTFFGDPQTVKVNGTSQLICVLGDATVTPH
jgi:hypothetical protein